MARRNNKISSLQRELFELKREVMRRDITDAAVDKLKITRNVCSTEIHTSENQCETPGLLLSEATWGEVYQRAATLIQERHVGNSAVTDYELLSNYTYPQYAGRILNGSETLTSREYKKLILQPYILQYQRMLTPMRKHISDMKMRSTNKMYGNYEVKLCMIPSTWFVDLLSVYRTTNRSDHFPKNKVHFLDTFMQTNIVDILKDEQPSTKEVSTYAMDIPFHLANFGSLITSTNYQEGSVSHTYTDVELLIHHAVRSSSISYADFLDDPMSYLCGSNNLVMSKVIQIVVEDILSEITSANLKFVRDKVSGVRLKDGCRVPPTTYKKLLKNVVVDDPFHDTVLLSTETYQRRQILSSPLVRLLNRDDVARKEQKKDVTRHESHTAVFATLQADSYTSFHKVYAMLVSAAKCIYELSQACDDKLLLSGINLLLKTCVLCGDSVHYASTTEAFPGLLFYTVLADETKHFKPGSALPAMATTAFYPDTPVGCAKKNFVNLFGRYMEALTTCDLFGKQKLKQHYVNERQIENSTIRYPPDTFLKDLRAAEDKNVLDVRAAYINTLMRMDTEYKDCQGNIDYFIQKDPKHIPMTPLNVNRNLLSFYTLPILYEAELFMVRKPNKMTVGELFENTRVQQE